MLGRDLAFRPGPMRNWTGGGNFPQWDLLGNNMRLFRVLITAILTLLVLVGFRLISYIFHPPMEIVSDDRGRMMIEKVPFTFTDGLLFSLYFVLTISVAYLTWRLWKPKH